MRPSKRDRLLEKLPDWLRVPAYFWLQKALGSAERELPMLSSLIPAGTRVLDVGAGFGMYAHVLASCAADVEAFEPQPRCARFLRGYKKNVHIHEVALSDHEGTETLLVPAVRGIRYAGLARLGGKPDGEQEELSVQVRTLDSFAFENVSFMKIDVEGHETKVLRGATRTIERNRPVMLIEIEQHYAGVPVDDVLRFAESFGYRSQRGPSGNNYFFFPK